VERAASRTPRRAHHHGRVAARTATSEEHVVTEIPSPVDASAVAMLRAIAARLETQGANPHRIRAYRRAAEALRADAAAGEAPVQASWLAPRLRRLLTPRAPHRAA
jgi:type IV pilus biogenesis protein CpaD/CtpE